jgi:hypothetical protein
MTAIFHYKLENWKCYNTGVFGYFESNEDPDATPLVNFFTPPQLAFFFNGAPPNDMYTRA